MTPSPSSMKKARDMLSTSIFPRCPGRHEGYGTRTSAGNYFEACEDCLVDTIALALDQAEARGRAEQKEKDGNIANRYMSEQSDTAKCLAASDIKILIRGQKL